MAEKPGDENEVEDVAEEALDVSSPNFVTGLALSQIERASDDDDARTLLREQARVLHLQAEHLHEQREVQLSHLKARRLSEWLKVGLQLLTAGVGLAVAALVVALIWEAASSRSVIVEAFDAPPALAARGVNGKVVASSVLDALTKLQTATRATTAKRKLANAWGGDIKVEVPETGVSIGELRRLLHEMMGRDVHIDGDLLQTADRRLQLTVRGDGILPQTFEGDADDLEGVAAKAAEYIYGQADPYLLAAYLSTVGRTNDALGFIAKAYPGARDQDRPDLLNQWGNALFALDQPQAAVEKYRAAIELKPDFWKAWGNLIHVSASAEGEEAAYKEGLRMMQTAKKYPSNDRPEPLRRSTLDALLQDWNAVYQDNVFDMKTHGAVGSYSTPASLGVAAVDVEQHDWQDAARNLDGSAQDDPSTKAERMLMIARRALEEGDAQTAITALEPLYAEYLADPRVRAYFPPVPCYLGLAYGLAERFDDAAKPLSSGQGWTSCKSFKGEVLDHRGDLKNADLAYRAAIALAPDLPFAYQQYGEALLRRGDRSGAIKFLSEAHDRGPHWADPLKTWGDVLAAEYRWPEAVAKYNSALVYAPHWQAAQSALDNAKVKAYAH